MRNILIILGIAVAAIAMSVLVTPKKDLMPRPADKYDEPTPAKPAAAIPAAGGGTAQSPVSTVPVGTKVAVVMTVKGKGQVELELYPHEAPRTVAQITDLIKKGFYNGVRFHRVVSGDLNVIQAGDPKSKGITDADVKARDDGQGGTTGLGDGGSGKAIPFEQNPLKNDEGTIAMARSQDKDSADSQIYINVKPNNGLDGSYCVFGKVTAGMDVVRKVVRGDVIERFALK